MRSDSDDEQATTAGPPMWALPLAMLLVGLMAVAAGAVAALTGGWFGGFGGERTVRITGTGLLQQRPDGPIVLCVGAVGDAEPATCGTTVAVTGVSWNAVPEVATHAGTTEGWATLTGVWSDGVLHVDTVEEPRSRTVLPAETFPQQLCLDPGGSTSVTAPGARPDPALLEQLPGFQGYWVTDGGTPSGGDGTVLVHNVAVRGNVDQARQQIRQSFDGPLCVGTIPGMTQAEAQEAMAKLTPQFADLGLLSGHPSLSGGWAGLDLEVFVVTPDVQQEINDILGPEMARWTTVRGQFRVVD